MRIGCLSIAIMLVIGTGAAAVSAQDARSGSSPPGGRMPQYDHIYTLRPREGVFAYARISPDGRRLAYAAQIRDERNWTISIVDLETRRILLTDIGIDVYWANDGARVIYGGGEGVTFRDVDAGTTVSAPEANGLGDYYSWAVRDGRDLILTIQSNYYYLERNRPALPASRVPSCEGIGTGERPLISHDGTRITTFVNGNLVVRGLDDCDDIFDTGIQGAKADFSWDGRYIAFHAVKPQGVGYEIRIVDLQERTVRTLTGLVGSGFFPSWTRDGRLCFRYDGPDYRGFIMASGVLDVPATPLPAASESLPARRTWRDIFPETPSRPRGMRLVLVWAPWSAHSLEAFTNLERAGDEFARQGVDVEIMEAADPGSRETDIADQLAEFRVTVPRIPLSQRGLALTEGRNQMPSVLLFRDDVLVGARLGAQSFESLRDWILPR